MTARPAFPTTLAGIDAAFLADLLGRPVAGVATRQLDEPWTSTVARLVAELDDGDTVRLVAKVRRPDRGHPVQFEQELHFYRHIASRLTCVPALRFGAMADDGAFLLVLDDAGGQHLRDGWDLDTTRRALAAIAQVHGACWGDETVRAGLRVKVVPPAAAADLADLVRTAWDGVATRFPRHLAVPPDLSDLPQAVTRLTPVTLTHNDLHAENVLVSPERLVFVDWQNATWGWPGYDVANLLACARPDVQRDHRSALLGGYAERLRRAGGPDLPDLGDQVRTSAQLLFAWMVRYLAGTTDTEAAGRRMLLAHWERVCAGVIG